MALTTGVCYVVYGQRAERVAGWAIDALQAKEPGLPYHVHRKGYPGLDNEQASRQAKVTLLDWSPYDLTCYMDADTRVNQTISAGFEILCEGFDMAIVPSGNQDGHDWLWHVGEGERLYTESVLSYRALQLQCGVMFVARNPDTQAFFRLWADEWSRFKGQDQAAFLRALSQKPVKLWLLGKPWNSNRGAVIRHNFGAV